MTREKDKAAERARNKAAAEEQSREGGRGVLNADDITFRHDLPPDHDRTDPKTRLRKEAETLPGSGEAAAAEEGAAAGTGLSYEEWTQRIRGAADGDEAYRAAMERLAGTEDARPAYTGSYDEDIREAYERILDREAFRYSLDDDALYRQYADRYAAAGRLSMRDTMGQAASLTGGYGSSYGQAAGQQAYDAWLQGLGDIALQMYDRAYGRYQDEGQALRDRYELARGMDADAYARYRDALGQWNTDRSYAADAAGGAWDRAYRSEGEAWDRWRQERDFEYDRQMDYASTLAQYGDFSGYAELFGEDRAAEMQKVWNAGNYDVAYNSGKITAEEYRAMTGKWPKGYKRRGGGSAGQQEDDGNRYDAVLTEVRILDGSGSSPEAIQSRIDAAYDAGSITKPQHDWLTDNFGSGSGNSGSGPSRPGQGPPALA